MANKIGNIYRTNCGNLKVIGKGKKKGYYICRFDDDTIVMAYCSAITSGSVKNPNSPMVYGAGYLGQGEHKAHKNGEKTKEYILWKDMIKRVYDSKYHEKSPSYKECRVSEEWLCFQNFCNDIKELKGYKEWLNSAPREYCLDKDLKVKNNKLYSKDTCVFITTVDNTMLSRGTYGTVYKATKDGIVYEFTNRRDFEREHGLHKNCITYYLKANKEFKGWRFEKCL